MRKLVGFLAAVLALAVCASQGTTPQLTTPAEASAKRPLVVIYFENKERSTIVGSSEADYFNSIRTKGKDFTHYYGVTHPSLPNYLALGNGSTDGKSGTDSISAGELNAGETLWNQLAVAGIGFNVYEESMPSVCYLGTSSGDYQLKHNPATPFRAVTANASVCNHVKPYPGPGASLARFNFIAPNMCNDMHDCSISTGDNWLAANLPPMLNANAKVIVTFDEGSTSTNGGGNIYTVEYYNGIAPSQRTGTFNHYSLLRAIEKKFGLSYLNNAANVNALPLR